jgi:hypothetical protein
MQTTYRWPVALTIAGLVLFLVATWVFVQGLGGWHTTFQGPGSIGVEVPAGDYRIWHESKTVIDGRLHRVDDELPAGATLEFADMAGNIIPIESIRGSMSQEIGNTRRVALGRIELPEAGRYTITMSGFDEPRQFRLSEIRLFEHFLRALVFGLPGALLFMTGLVWAIVNLVRGRDQGN